MGVTVGLGVGVGVGVTVGLGVGVGVVEPPQGPLSVHTCAGGTSFCVHHFAV